MDLTPLLGSYPHYLTLSALVSASDKADSERYYASWVNVEWNICLTQLPSCNAKRPSQVKFPFHDPLNSFISHAHQGNAAFW